MENPHLWQDWRVSSWINSDKLIHPYPSFFWSRSDNMPGPNWTVPWYLHWLLPWPKLPVQAEAWQIFEPCWERNFTFQYRFRWKKRLKEIVLDTSHVSPMFHVPDRRESVWLWWFWNFGMLRITAQTTNDVSFRCWLEDSKRWTMIECGFLTLACEMPTCVFLRNVLQNSITVETKFWSNCNMSHFFVGRLRYAQTLTRSLANARLTHDSSVVLQTRRTHMYD